MAGLIPVSGVCLVLMVLSVLTNAKVKSVRECQNTTKVLIGHFLTSYWYNSSHFYF